MYRRQIISTFALIALCLLLLGAGFFSLYYQYHLRDLKAALQEDVQHISDYTDDILQENPDIYSSPFLSYLDSVAKISNKTILLTDEEGNIAYIANADFPISNDLSERKVPSWAVDAVIDTIWSSDEFMEFTSFNGLFPQLNYVAGIPVIMSLSGDLSIKIPVGLIFVSSDASYVKDFLFNALYMFLLVSLAVMLISIIISSLTSQHMVQPLRAIAAAVYRFAHGDLDTRLTNYTDRKDEIGNLAKAFNVMAESLAQSEKRRSEFVANVSHELKTPMTTISGFAEGILDGTIPPSRERDALEIISSETRRLSRLVRRMLELSRLQSQERVAAQVQFDVSEILLRVLISLENKIEDKHLNIVTNLPEEGAMVWGDPDAITQVCYNLLDNAIKFSKEGGTLTLGIVFRGGKAHISIRNQGETIPPEQLSNIFERFHKADTSRSEHRDGVGLGLYIVKTILNTYKENISVTSEDGETEFTFTLSEV